jgi:ubiquinone/menaquinone biosynthesis C-methylase UbiE
LEIRENDSYWKEWQKQYINFYLKNQKSGIGRIVNNAGYKILKHIDLKDKNILEIGPVKINHLKYFKGTPKKYLIADNSSEMLKMSEDKLKSNNISYKSILLNSKNVLPLENQSTDIVLSFYSLEHMHPLNKYLNEIFRVLKPGGILAGCIPAEGELAWGLGRMITSRRWVKNNTNINPDKIICLEHPNFSDEIVSKLNKYFNRVKLYSWPIPFLTLIDFNLLLKFNYKKK